MQHDIRPDALFNDEDSNTSANPHFERVLGARLNRRNILRGAMAVDRLPDCGVYFGTTGGQVYVSADGGDHWQAIVRDLPPVLSISVQTLR